MLRDYQAQAINEVYGAWNEGAANVMLTAPTGSGKTVIVGHVLKAMNVPSAVIAHRQELLAQLSLTLNRESVPHSIIAPNTVIRQIVAAEMEIHGFSYYDARSHIRVAGVDTLTRRDRTKDAWYDAVQLAVVDEGHHVTKSNKWGHAMGMLPNARGLFVTAHAMRGDGLGLGRHADGLVDRLVIGPDARMLIDRGMLTDYRLCIPPSDLNLDRVHVGASGEFNAKEVAEAVHASPRIVGSIVQTYLKFARGKLGITFAVDIESATEIAAEYRAAGVPAEVITGETPLNIRAAYMQQFRRRQILQLVSVDVLGEGVDVPGVEVISMGRPTNSFQLFAQQIGRALRLLIDDSIYQHWGSYTDAQRLAFIAASAKPKALIIDHVQNVARFYENHGLPDTPQRYTLDKREARSSRPADAIPVRSCLECLQPFERVLLACPYCGEPIPEPAGRGSPEAVDGDVEEIDPAVLAAMRRALAKVDGPAYVPAAAPAAASGAIIRRHMDRQAAQQDLRGVMSLYGGLMELTESRREAQKRFYFQFGCDVLTAQQLGAKEAEALAGRIREYLDARNIIKAAA
jgi:superfamily II DNA or RNA helicase